MTQGPTNPQSAIKSQEARIIKVPKPLPSVRGGKMLLVEQNARNVIRKKERCKVKQKQDC